MYTKIESKFWQDKRIQKLSIEARYLMLYLLTSPHRNIIGIYYLPVSYACSDLGLNDQQFGKLLKELIDNDFVSYDEESNMVLVKNYLEHNPLENQNQIKGAIKKLNELPETFLIFEFYETVKSSNGRVPEEFIKGFQTLLKGLETLSEPFRTKKKNKKKNKKKKEEEEKEKKEIIAPDGAVDSDESTDSIKEIFDYYNEVFKDCWSKPLLLTPQRKKKISARLNNFTPEELKVAIRNIRASPFHCGDNDKGRIYATPEFIFRNDEIVDKWLKEEPRYGGIEGYSPPQVINPDRFEGYNPPRVV